MKVRLWKAMLVAFAFGILTSGYTTYRIEKTKGRALCARVVKGADAEIKHQLNVNRKLQDKIEEQQRRIIAIQNELGNHYGKSL